MNPREIKWNRNNKVLLEFNGSVVIYGIEKAFRHRNILSCNQLWCLGAVTQDFLDRKMHFSIPAVA